MRKSKSAFIMLLISFTAIIFFSMKVIGGESLGFDSSVATLFLTIFPEQTHSFFIFITFFGSKIGIAVAVLVLIIWLWIKKKNYAGIVLVLSTVGLGNGLNGLIKDWIKRPRPKLEHLVEVNSYSFPSGHAMVGTILYIVVAYFVFKELKTASSKWIVGILLGLFVFLVGASRIVLQVHYPSDIFMGFALGYSWFYVNIILYEKFLNRSSVMRKNYTNKTKADLN